MIPLDKRMAVTFFASPTDTRPTAARLTMRELAARISSTTAKDKSSLPLLSLCRYGGGRSAENVLHVAGVECDYDLGTMPQRAAQTVLRAAGVCCIVYATPSSGQPGKGHRWRVLCPLNHVANGEQRAAIVGKINHILKGRLSRESFALSQPFFYGNSSSVVLIEGDFIDRIERESLLPPKAASRGAPSRHGLVARSIGQVARALFEIPNGGDWHEWNEMGMALKNATADHDELGLKLFQEWSSTNPAYNERTTGQRWRHWDRHPSDSLGAGTIIWKAKNAR